jgi:hypothetical protein
LGGIEAENMLSVKQMFEVIAELPADKHEIFNPLFLLAQAGVYLIHLSCPSA